MKPAGGKDASNGSPKTSERSPPKSDASATGDDAPPARLKALEDERDRLKSELNDLRDRFLRARADYENLTRRSTKESLEAVRSAKGMLLLRFASVAETLERALADLDKATPSAAKGLKMALDDLRKILKEEGVREIETVGHPFNYQFHQAVDRVEAADQPEGTILETVQRGYLLQGDVLRPALVKVAIPPKRAPSREPVAGSTPS